jgi:uncharacterized protein YjiS (DUF1127 family)
MWELKWLDKSRVLPRWLRNAAVLALRYISAAMGRQWRLHAVRRQRLRAMTMLHELSDRELKDIGIPRSEIDWITQHGRVGRRRGPV